MSIGERIAVLRKEQNISQLQLSRLMDVSRQAVSKWENDLSEPDTLRLIQLADVLNTDVEYLATGKHSTKPAPLQVVTVVKNVDRLVEKVVEKVVEKPVYIEKVVEIEKPIETILEKTRIKKVFRTKYLRNPLEFIVVGVIAFIAGLLIGMLI